VNSALALPCVTGDDVTGFPAPVIAKVTVPPFTAEVVLETVADNVTIWFAELKATSALDAEVFVDDCDELGVMACVNRR
jgi:hypothetical protein